MCLRGASAVEPLLARDTTRLRVLVVWEHVTPSDHGVVLPGSRVLARVSDPRAIQFWDDNRLSSRVIVHDLPRDTLLSVAQVYDSVTTVAWDYVALYRPGVTWGDRFPVPDWAGRPVADVLERMRAQLDAIEARARASH